MLETSSDSQVPATFLPDSEPSPSERSAQRSGVRHAGVSPFSCQHFAPGLPGFTYPDLHDPLRLQDLLEAFRQTLQAADAALFARYDAYMTGADLDAVATSSILTSVAPHVGAFLARLFGVEDARRQKADLIAREATVMRFKGDFVARRIHKRQLDEVVAPDPRRTALLSVLRDSWLGLEPSDDEELLCASLVDAVVQLEKTFRQRNARRDPVPVSAESRARAGALQVALSGSPGLLEWLLSRVGTQPDEEATAHGLLTEVLQELEQWFFQRLQDPQEGAKLRSWESFRQPQTLDFEHLVPLEQPDPALPELFQAPASLRRLRDGFALTDPRMSPREIVGQVDYCLYCHERDRDSCSKGFRAREGGYKRNTLGVELSGCPLDEHISEMHQLKRDGNPLASLVVITADNPMLAGTGHQICNECMRACVFQKQEPVNIPQIETSILADVLEMPWGFEIWSLLTRWNPLNRRRPVALPYRGRQVLVVGLGPAGYTLAHHLLNEGFGVVCVDGLKLEPLPPEWLGDSHGPSAIRDVDRVRSPLDQRILQGFGGVSEYGITVRWDKNFLTLMYLSLARRPMARLFGGVRFGGTLTLDDAWALGLDHVALATGAGRPTIVPMKNSLARGVRQATDFLMGLQLGGAFRRDLFSSLQVRLPAVVIGGGLTAIDNATELSAYYVVQVEKTLERSELLQHRLGEAAFRASFDAESWEILQEHVAHGRQMREERARAAAEGREPALGALVAQWGGVTLAYRRRLVDSPAYRINYEEVLNCVEQGVSYLEKMSPLEAILDTYGAVSAVRFERMRLEDERWKGTGEEVVLPARSLFFAAGTSANVAIARENPGIFEMRRDGYLKGYRPMRDGAGQLRLEPCAEDEAGFLSSYRVDAPGDGVPRLVSFFGDNHPQYAGTVVKAMASAKHGYQVIRDLFAEELDASGKAPIRPSAEFERMASRLEATLQPSIERISRLGPELIEVVVRAPQVAARFQPGQFFRLQNLERFSTHQDGTTLLMEGLALAGARVDADAGLVTLVVQERGASSRLVRQLRPGEPICLMGPNGAPWELVEGKTVMLLGGGIGNAALFSLASALKARGNRILYLAGFAASAQAFWRDEIEALADTVIWAWESGEALLARRPQDRHWQGTLLEALEAYQSGRLGARPIPLCEVDQVYLSGSDRMMASVKQARQAAGPLEDTFRADTPVLAELNSPMQCMLKEVCARCLQRQVDPLSGREQVIFACFNPHQPLEMIDFTQLQARLRMNDVQDRLADLWVQHLLEAHAPLEV